nr:60S ribosomal protein L21 [Cryptomonas paramecium]
MARSNGKRSNTRDMATRGFRYHGIQYTPFSFTNFKVGDIVDININSCIHKGMPYKFYHGKTGKIFSIYKSSVGVKLKKKVRGKNIIKKINVKFGHFKKSICKFEFLNRIKSKEKVKHRSGLNQKYFFFQNKPYSKDKTFKYMFNTFKHIHPEPFHIII